MAEIEDQGILFKARKDEIAGNLADMKKAEIDVTEYEKEFKQIIDKAEAVSVSSGDAFPGADMAIYTPVGIYTSVLQELDDLQNKIEKLDSYFKCSCSCDQILSLLDSPSFDASKEMHRIVKETLHNLNEIIFSSQEPFEKEAAVVEKVVTVAYRVIKLEILQNGKSTIISYIKQNARHVGLFETLIRNELAHGNLKYQDAINQRIAKINENGIRENLLDEELIMLIVISTDQKAETKMKTSFQQAVDKAKILERDNTPYIENIEQIKKKQKWTVPKIFGRSLLLAGTVLIMNRSVYGIMHKTYSGAYVTTYPTTYQEMYDGKVVADFEREESKKGLSNVQIITYSPYEPDGSVYSREIRTYTLPDAYHTYSLEELSSLDYNTLEYESEPEKKDALFPSDYYEEDLVRIIRIYEDESHPITEYDEEIADKLTKIALGITMTVESIALVSELVFLCTKIVSTVKNRKQKKEALEMILNAFQESEKLENMLCQRYPMYQSLFGEEKVEKAMDDLVKTKKKFETCL